MGSRSTSRRSGRSPGRTERSRSFSRRTIRSPARPAILSGLVRRAVQMAPAGRDLGHAAIRPAPRGEPAPGGDHDAAADEAAQGADRRSAHSGDAGVDVGQRSQSRAWLSRCDRRALSRHAARAPGARCRAARGPSRRALAARSDRAGTRARRAGDAARGGGGRPAGVKRGACRCLRHRRCRAWRRRAGLCARRPDARAGEPARMGARRGRAPIAASRRTASWPRSIRAASWSRR